MRTAPLEPPTSAPLTSTRSTVLLAKRPNHANGRTIRKSISSSKYHLWTKKLVQRRRSAPAARPACRSWPHSLQAIADAGEAEHARRRPARATPARPSARASRRARSPRTSARGSGAALSHARDLQEAADDREHGQRAHRDLHRHRALGDVVLGAGEADVGVLDLAGRRVGRLRRVVEVPVRELLGLRAHLAVEGAEDHPERVDRGQERAEVAGDAEERVPAAALELAARGSRPWRRSPRTAGRPTARGRR